MKLIFKTSALMFFWVMHIVCHGAQSSPVVDHLNEAIKGLDVIREAVLKEKSKVVLDTFQAIEYHYSQPEYTGDYSTNSPGYPTHSPGKVTPDLPYTSPGPKLYFISTEDRFLKGYADIEGSITKLKIRLIDLSLKIQSDFNSKNKQNYRQAIEDEVAALKNELNKSNDQKSKLATKIAEAERAYTKAFNDFEDSEDIKAALVKEHLARADSRINDKNINYLQLEIQTLSSLVKKISDSGEQFIKESSETSVHKGSSETSNH